NTRAGKLLALARPQPSSVEPGALAGGGGPGLVAGRGDEHADQRLAGADQGHRNRPAGSPADEVARAVDRVDQPAQASFEPFGMIDRLFRKPAGGRKQGAELATQERVDFEVGGADRA